MIARLLSVSLGLPMPSPRAASERFEVSDFEKELAFLINRRSVENESDTPDFLLAQFLVGCLEAYAETVNARDKWYGDKHWEDTEASPLPVRFDEILEALGEASALFMSNSEPGTSQVMPSQDLERIAHDLAMRLSKHNCPASPPATGEREE